MASQSTQSHEVIQQWAESHGAIPTIVSRTGGMLRFEFDPSQAGSLTPVAWDEFFQVFDEKRLQLLYDDKPGSRFHKFVYPETLAKAETPPARSRRRLEIISGRERAGDARPGKSASAGAGRSRRSLSRAGKESESGSTQARTASARATRRATAALKTKTPKRTQKKAARSPRRRAA